MEEHCLTATTNIIFFKVVNKRNVLYKMCPRNQSHLRKCFASHLDCFNKLQLGLRSDGENCLKETFTLNIQF